MKKTVLSDVTGCEEIKWGMRLTQVKDLLGSKAQIRSDPKTGKTLETVTMMIGGIELNGFVSTKPGSDHINGVYLFFNGALPAQPQVFKRLKHTLTEKYGPPSKVLSDMAGRGCFWAFASGNILLTSMRPQSEKGVISALSYMAVMYPVP